MEGSTLISRRFLVTLRGSGFIIPLEGGKPARGFYAIRRIRATSAADAEHQAITSLQAEERYRLLTDGRQSGKVELEIVKELSWLSWHFSRLPRGFIFYIDENAG